MINKYSKDVSYDIDSNVSRCANFFSNKKCSHRETENQIMVNGEKSHSLIPYM